MTTIIQELYLENQIEVQLIMSPFDVTVTLFDTENDEIISTYQRTIEEYNDYECLLELYADIEGYYVDEGGCSNIPEDIDLKITNLIKKTYVK